MSQHGAARRPAVLASVALAALAGLVAAIALGQWAWVVLAATVTCTAAATAAAVTNVVRHADPEAPADHAPDASPRSGPDAATALPERGRTAGGGARRAGTGGRIGGTGLTGAVLAGVLAGAATVAVGTQVSDGGDVSGTASPAQDLDGRVATITLAPAENADVTDEALEQARAILRARLDGADVPSAQVEIRGRDIVITVPAGRVDQVRAMVTVGRLRFRPVIAGPEPTGGQPTGGGSASPPPPAADPGPPVPPAPPPGVTERDYRTAVTAFGLLDCAGEDHRPGDDDPRVPLAACDAEGTGKYLLAPTLIEGTGVEEASAQPDAQGSGGWTVTIELTDEAAATWLQYTSQHNVQVAPDDPGNLVAFVVDGVVVSAPQIQGAIGGQVQVTGAFDRTAAQRLANTLRSGALPLAFSDPTVVID